MNTQREYPTNVTQAQWQLLIPLLPKRKWRKGGPGRPPANLRQVFNGILYLTKTGSQWRMLPHTFGCWQTVYGYFNKWREQGIFEQVQQALTRRERKRQGRKPTASAGCIDSQSVKTATQGKSKGYDAGKKVNGRKRHLLVDTLGLVISTYVSPADLQDRDGLKQVLNQYFDTGETRLRKLWVDGSAIEVKTSRNGSLLRSRRIRLILRLSPQKAKAFNSSNAGGSSSAPLLGYLIFADYQRIMKT